MADEIRVEVEPWGPEEQVLTDLAHQLMEFPRVRDYFGNVRFRLLSINLSDRAEKTTRPIPPREYYAQVYDYTNNRNVVIRGRLDQPELVEIEEFGNQPLPSVGEFEAAVQLLQQDADFGQAIRDGRLEPYPPMPPLITDELPDGRSERIVTVGLRSPSEAIRHRLVAVNMTNQSILHDIRDIFHPSDAECGPPGHFQCETGGTQQARVRVIQGRTTVWSFIAVRPATSSGTNGSGIELRHVYYRGKQVLYRAHVPILNVEYGEEGIAAGCGPTYRDWQNSETCFEAVGSDPVPGFRLCSGPAKTILDTGSDVGNFKGVAIYVDGAEVVLVSELVAGWYRYISEWRLHIDGTIHPRFGFAATDNPCTCKPHHHHAYWRFDFDIRTAGNNRVEEFNDPPLFFGSNWHTKKYEIQRRRDSTRNRKWRVINTVSAEGYEIIPGSNDGTADTYGVSDLWVLRYHGSSPPPMGEGDDGQSFTTDWTLSRANISKFVNGELVDNNDVVIWYAGHFFHDEQHNGGSHIVGPTLSPFNW